MTNKEAIDIIKRATAEVEWEYPMEIAAALDKAVEALQNGITNEVPEIIVGFAKLAKLLANGAKIKAGQKVDCLMDDMGTTEWVVVETRPEIAGDGCVIVAQRTVSHYGAFSDVSKKYPYGCNDYATSKARAYLNGEFADSFIDADYDLPVIEPRSISEIGEQKDKFWLLSENEVCGENAFEWFMDKKNRMMKDNSGDKCVWFLRGPRPSYANYVRYVGADGSLSGHSAYYAYGFVAACIIRYQNIQPA